MRFLEGEGGRLVETCHAEHPTNGFPLDADGRLIAPLAALKREVQQASARAGLYCPHLPPRLGGLGLGLRDCFFLQEAVYRRGLQGLQWALAWTDGPSPIVADWRAEARARLLDDFVAGRVNVAFALTEPGAGSDFPALATTARRDGDGWILDGHKHLITGVPFVEYAQVFARTPSAGRGELTAFLVPLDAPGVSWGMQPTIMADGQTGWLRFEEVRLPAWSVIGDVDGGRDVAFRYINWTRTRRAGQAAGLGAFCLARALEHTQWREAYGRPIARLGAVEGLLSELYLDHAAARALSLERLAALDARGTLVDRPTAEDRRDVATIKAINDDALYRVADRAIQIHGGVGLLTSFELERIFRLARNLLIPAGTAQVQRAMLARSLVELGDQGAGVADG